MNDVSDGDRIPARAAEAIGHFIEAYGEVEFALRVLLKEMMTLGVHDIHTAVYEIDPRARSVIGHLSTQSISLLIESMWDPARLGRPLGISILASLRLAEEQRNRVVHANWVPDDSEEPDPGTPTAWRSRFHRRRSMYVSGPLPVGDIEASTSGLLRLREMLFAAADAVETKKLQERDRFDETGERSDRYHRAYEFTDHQSL